jgi:hypothetical protein
MKNIHVLPTDKPSNGYILGKCIKELSDVKIGQFTKTYYLMFDNEYFQPHNIYITSDEEIKEDDWMIWNNRVVQAIDTTYYSAKKIILTTDQDLIKDGVQAIPNEFLEWFVDNPSCEEVEVKKLLIGKDIPKINFTYKIILPKEEPKQETLEEAAEKHFLNSPDAYGINEECRNSFIEGAKWQQEQDKKLYSEEEFELIEYIQWIIRKIDKGDTPEETVRLLLFEREKIEQFKKK